MTPIAFKPHIDLIGFPMDLGANRRGVDMGPSALRIAGIGEKLTALGFAVADLGDIPIEIMEKQAIANPRLKYLHEIVKTSQMLADTVARSLAQGHFPLCIGGDHSMALGTIAGIATHCREQGLRPGVIWIDAHPDMNTEETTPSGNIHGMPLAAALGLGAPALTGIGGFSPKIASEDCALLGVRRIDALEKQTIRQLSMAVYTMTDIDRRGIDPVITEILDRFRGRVDHIHVSFDLDAVDPSVAGGVGTREPGGLSFREAHLIMETIAECGCMGSLEIAEVNPILDHQNQSAEFAAEIAASSLGLRIL